MATASSSAPAPAVLADRRSSRVESAPALLARPAVAWPTLALAVTGVAAFAGIFVGGAAGAIPWPIALPVQALVAFACFTPMHDASHRAIARARWPNELVGWLCGAPVLAPFAAFRALHLEHHAYTNDRTTDPDMWSGRARSRVAMGARWLVKDLHYLARYLATARRRPAAEFAQSAAGLAAIWGALAALALAGHGAAMLALWLIPSRIAIAMLSVVFDWLPHHPRRVRAADDPYRATSVVEARWLTPVLLGQNYHLIHHLYPGVPFYRYGRAYWTLRDDLLARGAFVRGPGRTTAPLPPRPALPALRVAAVIDETSDARTFVLDVPDELRASYAHRAGQFVVVELALPDRPAVRRCYSISAAPLAITVKRQLGGVASTWLHDHLRPGDLLRVGRPQGRFVLADSPRRIALVAAGSGITAVIAIAEDALLTTARPVALLYANRDATSVIFRARLDALARAHPARFTLAHHLGPLDVPAIAALLDASTDLYTCGPAPVLDLADRAAAAAGIPPDRRFAERFAPRSNTRTGASNIVARPGDRPTGVVAPRSESLELATTFTAIRGAHRHELVLLPDETLLAAARRAGLEPRSSCEDGYCGTCAARLVCGAVDARATGPLSDAELATGFILPCSARPLAGEPVVVDLDAAPHHEETSVTITATSLVTTPPAPRHRDDLGRVFERMQLQRGESFDFAVGLLDAGATDYRWTWYSHLEFDGIAMLEHVAKHDYAHQLVAPRLKVRPDRRARFVEYLKPFLKPAYLRAAPLWAWHTEPLPPRPERRVPKHAIELGLAETLEVAAVARRLDVSVSSLVLWALADAMRPYARRPTDPQYWTLPVNMRGGDGLSSDAANIISFVRVMIRQGDTPAVVHERLYELLDGGMHWVMLSWIRFFARRSRMVFPPVRSSGCLSNIGSYTIPNGLERLMFTPPPGTTEPISAGMVSINGRLTLALATHHSLQPPPGALDDVAARWRQRMLRGA